MPKVTVNKTGQKRCEKDFCDKYIEKLHKITKNIQMKLIDNSKIDNNKKKEIKKKTDKIIQQQFIKNKKTLKNKCIDGFCNPTCKNTIFENGKGNTLPKGVVNKLKKNKTTLPVLNNTIKLLIDMRKRMYGTNTTVIKDGFYKGLNKTTIKKLKKDGALSGCSVIYL